MGSTRPWRLGERVRRLGAVAGVGLLGAASTLAFAQGKPATSAATSSVSGASAQTSKAHALDLSLPPLRLVLTPEELRALTERSQVDIGTQDVTIREAPYQVPVPVGSFRALGWAIVHPLDAWRILAPIPNR